MNIQNSHVMISRLCDTLERDGIRHPAISGIRGWMEEVLKEAEALDKKIEHLQEDLALYKDGYEREKARVGALERVPVKQERTLVGDYRCPNCNAAFIEGLEVTPFCGNCGQALDWEDTRNGR